MKFQLCYCKEVSLAEGRRMVEAKDPLVCANFLLILTWSCHSYQVPIICVQTQYQGFSWWKSIMHCRAMDSTWASESAQERSYLWRCESHMLGKMLTRWSWKSFLDSLESLGLYWVENVDWAINYMYRLPCIETTQCMLSPFLNQP